MAALAADDGLRRTAFVAQVEQAEAAAKRLAGWYRFRRSVRERHEALHWAEVRQPAGPAANRAAAAAAAAAAGWRVAQQPRIAGRRCKVDRLRRGVVYAPGCAFGYVPTGLDGAQCIRLPPDSARRHRLTLTLTSRAWLWMLVDRRCVDAVDPLATAFFGEHFEPVFDDAVLGANNNPNYWCVYKSVQPWRRGAVVQVPPVAFHAGPGARDWQEPIFVTVPAEGEGLPTDFDGVPGGLTADDVASPPPSPRPVVSPRGGHHGRSSRGGGAGAFGGRGGVFGDGGGGGGGGGGTAAVSDIRADQALALHALSEYDLRAMCREHGASRASVNDCSSKQDLVALLQAAMFSGGGGTSPRRVRGGGGGSGGSGIVRSAAAAAAAARRRYQARMASPTAARNPGYPGYRSVELYQQRSEDRRRGSAGSGGGAGGAAGGGAARGFAASDLFAAAATVNPTPAPSAPTTNSPSARVLYDFTPAQGQAGNGQVPLLENTGPLTVVEVGSNGWTKVENHARDVGWVPSSYLAVIEPPFAQDARSLRNARIGL